MAISPRQKCNRFQSDMNQRGKSFQTPLPLITSKSLWPPEQKVILAMPWEKGAYRICGHRRPWSDCVETQSDQGIRCPSISQISSAISKDSICGQWISWSNCAVRMRTDRRVYFTLRKIEMCTWRKLSAIFRRTSFINVNWTVEMMGLIDWLTTYECDYTR